jgi:hypothetical protein
MTPRSDRAGLVTLLVVGVLAGTLAVVSAAWPAVAPTRSDNRQPGAEYPTAVSDLPYTAVRNGLGPVERDRANGGADVDDGGPLAVGDRVFDRGLGVHAPSWVRLYPAATCTRFVAEIGLGASSDTRGSVVFKVFVAGAVRFESPRMTSGDGVHHIDVSLDQRGFLDLVVSDADDGDESDVASWADAVLMCQE